MNIVETATAAGNFNVLVAAVEAADLAETLSGEGPFTVFAPTDDAFAAAEIDMTNTEALIATLNYHVALDKYLAADLAGMPTVTTLGGDVTITVTEEGDLMVNDAKIVQEDIVCSNGVIQVIDAVLMLQEEMTEAVTPATETTGDTLEDIVPPEMDEGNLGDIVIPEMDEGNLGDIVPPEMTGETP
jgi:uncharacterized surface protein with fasciclin (FAS1) repeats